MTSISDWEGFTPKEPLSLSRREFHGPCMVDGAGNDRFIVWPERGEHGRYYCRQECPDCRYTGDLIDFLRQFCGISFAEACKRVGKNTHKRSLDWVNFKREPAAKHVKPSARQTISETKVKATIEPPKKELIGEILTHPVNGWCFLGQEFCNHHIYYSNSFTEKCSQAIHKKYGELDLGLLSICPIKEGEKI